MNKIHPSKIIVKEGLERYRKDITNLTSLAQSIEEHGQLVPIIITSNFELIDGGRRIAACILKNIEVSYIFKDVNDDLNHRELEFETNRRREDFSPADQAFAIEDIHKRRQKAMGVPTRGSANSGWTVKDTAKKLGYTQGAISQNLIIAETLKSFPELVSCKTAVEIKQAVRGVYKKLQREKAIREIESSGESLDVSHLFHLGDFREWIKSIPENSIDILITDPPYGINIDTLMCTGGNVTGGNSFQGFKFDDSPDVSIYRILAEQANRICKKDTAFAIVFISTDYFYELRNQFLRNNWEVSVRPIVWVKPGGSSNSPKSWLISSYEIAMFARRKSAYLIKEGVRDVITGINPVSSSSKVHPTEKPVDLFRYLLSIVSLPGMTMIDPFCGSGSSLIAGLREKLTVRGCDILPECKDVFIEKLLCEGLKFVKGEKNANRSKRDYD